MQTTSRLVRAFAAAASIALVAAVLMGASWYAGESGQAAPGQVVGVPTGEYVNGVEVQPAVDHRDRPPQRRRARRPMTGGQPGRRRGFSPPAAAAR